MMKALMQRIIQLRNPNFQFDPSVNTYILLVFSGQITSQMLRGLRLLLMGRNPKGMILGKGTRFLYRRQIQWGRWNKIGRHVVLSGLGKKGVILGDNTGIGDFSRVIVSTSLNDTGHGIFIGDNVGIGEYAYLGGGGGLWIGNGCIIGQYFSCHSENHQFEDINQPIRFQGVTRTGIRIGADCWIGSKVTVLDGAVVGNGCVIAAGAVVRGTFPDHCIIGGVPAKIIKFRYATH